MQINYDTEQYIFPAKLKNSFFALYYLQEKQLCIIWLCLCRF